MVWSVYGITYFSANLMNTTSKAYSFKPDLPRLLATTSANMGAGIAKDRAYARMFGTVAPRGLPASSYLFFFSRDLVTMGASFNIPEPLAQEMHTTLGVPLGTADVAAQVGEGRGGRGGRGRREGGRVALLLHLGLCTLLFRFVLLEVLGSYVLVLIIFPHPVTHQPSLRLFFFSPSSSARWPCNS